VALPPFRPAAAFCAFVPPRVDPEREAVDAERDLDVPEDVERERDVPDVVRFLAAADVARAFVVPDARDVVVRDVDLDFAAVALPPLLPAAFF